MPQCDTRTHGHLTPAHFSNLILSYAGDITRVSFRQTQRSRSYPDLQTSASAGHSLMPWTLADLASALLQLQRLSHSGQPTRVPPPAPTACPASLITVLMHLPLPTRLQFLKTDTKYFLKLVFIST